MSLEAFPHCCTNVTVSVISVAERGKKFQLTNPLHRSVTKVMVDGCVMKHTVACDWMLIPTDAALEYYVELKGSDVQHAVAQLKASIQNVSSAPKAIRKRCFVICARSPLVTTQIQQIMREFKTSFNSTFLVRSMQYSEELVPCD